MNRALIIGSVLAVFLVAAAEAPRADQPLLLGRGVNLELWGSFSQHGTPSERIDRANAAGFTFLRLGISISPWLRDEVARFGSLPAFLQDNVEALKKKSLDDLAEAIDHARAVGLKPLVALFVIGTRPAAASDQILCDIPSGQEAYLAALRQVLTRVPDAHDIALEPFNEAAGGCIATPVIHGAAVGTMWLPLQWKIYQMVRAQKPHVTFIVTAGSYEQIDGMLSFDPTPYLGDGNTVMAVHYYLPKLYTCQNGACRRRAEHFGRDIPWPVDETRLAESRNESFRSLDRGDLQPAQLTRQREDLNEAFARYRVEGTVEYLRDRFRQLADWANRYRLDPKRILIGEFGVHRPTNGTAGTPLDDAGDYLSAVRTTAESHGFSWAIWDLDGGMAVLCGAPPNEAVCPSYRKVIGAAPH